jgi:hypothetical protein
MPKDRILHNHRCENLKAYNLTNSSLSLAFEYSEKSVIPQVQQPFLHLQHTRHQLSLDGAGLGGLDVDSVKSSSDYLAYLCISASETMLYQKRMSYAERFHL